MSAPLRQEWSGGPHDPARGVCLQITKWAAWNQESNGVSVVSLIAFPYGSSEPHPYANPTRRSPFSESSGKVLYSWELFHGPPIRLHNRLLCQPSRGRLDAFTASRCRRFTCTHGRIVAA